jgi:hypothetical protein
MKLEHFLLDLLKKSSFYCDEFLIISNVFFNCVNIIDKK